MESIKMLVQVLVIMTVLVVFLEMMLPNNEMYGYVKMIMGLVIIVVVLEAGAGLLRQDLKIELPALNQNQPEVGLEKILQDGQKMAGNQKQRAVEEYQQGLEKQVMALARLNGEINVTGAKVQTAANPQDPDFGRLTGVVLEISREPADGGQGAGETTVPKVDPVEITVGSKPAREQPPGRQAAVVDKGARELAQTVANFYNLPVDKVKVVEAKP
ncbi:stage III sporulation protein AF [Desulforamulus ruminis]|uniref:stage III sporulation protein AF n=1 Tax=Desulforamulus ruminis TaxID=1564 RepID=UPI002FD98467